MPEEIVNQPAGKETNPTPPKPTGDEGDHVSKSAYEATKADLHKFKEEARILREEKEAAKANELKAQEKWKEFGTAKEQEAADWRKKYETLSTSHLERTKIEAVKAQCKALGLIDAAADDLEAMEFKDVVVETTSTGRVNVIGAKGAAERMKSLRPHWFQSTTQPPVNTKIPSANNGAGGGEQKASAFDELNKLEAEAKKTGDYTQYQAALMKLKTKK